MKPPAFDYRVPRSLEEALALRSEYSDDSVVLAGGQSLVALLNLRLARPAVVIDIARVPGFDTITQDGGDVVIGAMVRQIAAERSPMLRQRVPLLFTALRHVGHIAIRNRGTICGSLAHADPAAELPAVTLVTDARMIVASVRGRRSIPAAEFFQGFLTTALAPDELLLEVRIPSPERPPGSAFHELSRRHGDFALTGATAALRTEPDGSISHARLAFIGVGATAVRAPEAEAFLHGQQPTAEACTHAAELAARTLTPASDIHATGEYRRRVAGVLANRALREASA